MSAGDVDIRRCGPKLPGERELIADYLEHLGPAETRRMLVYIAASAEGLLDRIETAVLEGDQSFRRIAHDIAGTLGSLGLAVHAAMAQSIEGASSDLEPADLDRLLQPLLAARGRVTGSVMATLDDLLIETRLREAP